MPESNDLNAIITMIFIMIITTFVNSRNEYVTENEIMDKAISDEVDVKLPVKRAEIDSYLIENVMASRV